MINDGFTYFDAARLYAIAKEAYSRSLSVEKDELANDVLVAIFFAGSTLEAFMSQSVFMAETWAHNHPKIEEYASTLRKLFEKRASLKRKYNEARRIILGQYFDEDDSLFQDFSLLVDVRNTIVHLTPDTIPNKKAESILNALHNRELTRSYQKDMRYMWTLYILHSKMAKWSCNTASKMIQGFWKGVREKRVEIFFRIHSNAAHYTPIE